jgi:hypothetical protein
LVKIQFVRAGFASRNIRFSKDDRAIEKTPLQSIAGSISVTPSQPESFINANAAQ